MDKLKKLQAKKGMSKMHPLERKAKMGVVHDMQKMAHDAMSGKLKGMNKVSVAADSPEGLQHGLDHAHDLLGHLPPALDDSHTDHENFEGADNEADGNDGMDSFPDADDAHQLEANPMHQHMRGEAKEGNLKGHKFAQGGEVGDEDYDNDNSSSEASELPNYDDMDDGEMSAHMEALVSAMKNKGMR